VGQAGPYGTDEQAAAGEVRLRLRLRHEAAWLHTPDGNHPDDAQAVGPCCGEIGIGGRPPDRQKNRVENDQMAWARRHEPDGVA
jgi:hypothetical protein